MAAQDDDADLIALGAQLDAYEQAWWDYMANGATNPELEAIEEDRLGAWGSRLLPAIAAARATTPEGRAVQLQAVAHCDRAGDLTPCKRIGETTNHADALARAIVRDLLAEQAAA